MIKPKLALIGCGIWGQKILRDLIKLNCSVAVYESNKTIASRALNMGADAFEIGLPKKGGYDGIIVATPSSSHRYILEEIMPLQIPVFVEKPLTNSYKDAVALRQIVHKEVFLMHVWLYHPGIQALEQISQSGELGNVLGVRSTRSNWTSPRRDTDSVWNLAPHDITIAKAILGYIPEPKAVIVEEHQGIARGMFAFLGKNPYCTFEVSNRYERKIREVRLHCEGGVALLKDEIVDFVEIVRGDANSKAEKLQIEKRYFDKTPALYRELEEFVNYLKGGKAPRSDFYEGLEVVKTIDKLLKLAE